MPSKPKLITDGATMQLVNKSNKEWKILQSTTVAHCLSLPKVAYWCMHQPYPGSFKSSNPCTLYYKPYPYLNHSAPGPPYTTISCFVEDVVTASATLPRRMWNFLVFLNFRSKTNLKQKKMAEQQERVQLLRSSFLSKPNWINFSE